MMVAETPTPPTPPTPSTPAAQPELPAPATTSHTIVHHEIPADDAEKLIAFYCGVFGWTFAASPVMDSYRMAKTGDGQGALSIGIYVEGNPMGIWQHDPTAGKS